MATDQKQEKRDPLAGIRPEGVTHQNPPEPAKVPGWVSELQEQSWDSAGAYALATCLADGDRALTRTDRDALVVAALQADIGLTDANGYAGITGTIVANVLALEKGTTDQALGRLVRFGVLEWAVGARAGDGSKLARIPEKVLQNLTP